MKGVIFSEFVEMVEDSFSPELADAVISECHLPSGGAYTSVGTYDHTEMLQLVGKLSEKTGISTTDLVLTFGNHMFGRFAELYPEIFAGIDNAFQFLERIEDHVHVEVRKLYHDTELPTFETSQPDERTLIMIYKSRRPLANMALGLTQGCIAYFGEDISIEQEDMSTEEFSHVRFTLRKH